MVIVTITVMIDKLILNITIVMIFKLQPKPIGLNFHPRAWGRSAVPVQYKWIYISTVIQFQVDIYIYKHGY